VKIIILVSSVLLLPFLTGYDFILSWLYELCVTIIIGGFFSFFVKDMTKNSQKITTSIIISLLLFIILGAIAAIDAFTGYQKTENKWTKNSYTVKYIRDQGFAGGPLMKYEVHHSPILGLYNKKIQTISDHSEKFNECILIFDKANVQFDKCTKKIITTP